VAGLALSDSERHLEPVWKPRRRRRFSGELDLPAAGRASKAVRMWCRASSVSENEVGRGNHRPPPLHFRLDGVRHSREIEAQHHLLAAGGRKHAADENALLVEVAGGGLHRLTADTKRTGNAIPLRMPAVCHSARMAWMITGARGARDPVRRQRRTGCSVPWGDVADRVAQHRNPRHHRLHGRQAGGDPGGAPLRVADRGCAAPHPHRLVARPAAGRSSLRKTAASCRGFQDRSR